MVELAVLLDLGVRSLGEAGLTAAAIDYFQSLVDEVTNRLGPGHTYTLGTRGNLARSRGEAGDAAGAAAACETLLADQLRVLGPDHPDTLTTRGELARWRGEAGDAAGAMAAYEALLVDWQDLRHALGLEDACEWPSRGLPRGGRAAADRIAHTRCAPLISRPDSNGPKQRLACHRDR